MRIGVNVRLLLSENMEGIPRYIYETTMQMAQDHPEDKFILFFDRKVDVNFGFPPNVKSVVVPWHARHPILWYWWFEVMIPFYLWWYRIEVFYSGDGYLSLQAKVPTVIVMHDLAYMHYPEHVASPSLNFYRKYVPKYLHRADKIITVSAFVKSDIIKQFSIPEERIEIAYNAVSSPVDVSDIVLPEEIQLAIEDKPYFIYVGALHPRKNIQKLIEAFLIFNENNQQKYKLVLAGRLAWKTEEIKKAIQASPYIIHTGMVSEGAKYKLISGARALVYISLFEGFGIPLLEAMKMGTPVITSSVTSMPEVAGGAAILVDPTDVNAIATAMETIGKDDALRKKLSEKGWSRYRDFRWKVSADTIYTALSNVVSSR
jgi:glycosyltransferase involved in cell wall biosynthesis